MSDKTPDTLVPIAQHGQQKTPSAFGFLARLLGVAALVFGVALAGTAASLAAPAWFGFAGKAEALDGELPGFGGIQGSANILIVGVDQCPTDPAERAKYGGRCTDVEDGPVGANEVPHNDVNLLVHISEEPRKVTAISFSRDIVTELPGCTDADGVYHPPIEERINESYSRGGLNCVAKTIEQLSGNTIDIQYAAMTTWTGVVNITNAIGGVEVCIENGIYDEHTGLNWEPGTRELKGQDALQFLRTRHGVGDGGDLTRMSNQQVYMSALARKIMDEGTLTDVPTLMRLATTALDNVIPSTSLTSPVEAVNIAQALRGVPLNDISFVSYPVSPNPLDPFVTVVPDEEAAGYLWTALANNQSIEVTGTTTGFEQAKEVDPVTGNEIDPRTGWQIDPETQLLIDPETGELTESDWVESLPEFEAQPEDETDAGTAGPVDPNAPVVLPEQITGTTAADITCSGGRGTDY